MLQKRSNVIALIPVLEGVLEVARAPVVTVVRDSVEIVVTLAAQEVARDLAVHRVKEKTSINIA